MELKQLCHVCQGTVEEFADEVQLLTDFGSSGMIIDCGKEFCFKQTSFHYSSAKKF